MKVPATLRPCAPYGQASQIRRCLHSRRRGAEACFTFADPGASRGTGGPGPPPPGSSSLHPHPHPRLRRVPPVQTSPASALTPPPAGAQKRRAASSLDLEGAMGLPSTGKWAPMVQSQERGARPLGQHSSPGSTAVLPSLGWEEPRVGVSMGNRRAWAQTWRAVSRLGRSGALQMMQDLEPGSPHHRPRAPSQASVPCAEQRPHGT